MSRQFVWVVGVILFCQSYKFYSITIIIITVNKSFTSNNATKENNMENETAAHEGEVGRGRDGG